MKEQFRKISFALDKEGRVVRVAEAVATDLYSDAQIVIERRETPTGMTQDEYEKLLNETLDAETIAYSANIEGRKKLHSAQVEMVRALKGQK